MIVTIHFLWAFIADSRFRKTHGLKRSGLQERLETHDSRRKRAMVATFGPNQDRHS